MKKPCARCERPKKLCECLLGSPQIQVWLTPRQRSDGTKYIRPSVEVATRPGKTEATYFAPGQQDLATDFARFLRSDAIFDCHIPERFRGMAVNP
jgi:hypothetical protein